MWSRRRDIDPSKLEEAAKGHVQDAHKNEAFPLTSGLEASVSRGTAEAGIPEAVDTASRPSADAASTNQLQQLLQKKFLSAKFGDIVGLLSRSPSHRNFSLGDLEWLAIPPIALNQYVLAEAKLSNGASVPVGVVFWARLSTELDAEFTKSPRYPLRLHPREWQSGDELWIVDAAGDPKIIASIIETLAKTAFAGKAFKMLPVVDAKSIIAAQKAIKAESTEGAGK